VAPDPGKPGDGTRWGDLPSGGADAARETWTGDRSVVSSGAAAGASDRGLNRRETGGRG